MISCSPNRLSWIGCALGCAWLLGTVTADAAPKAGAHGPSHAKTSAATAPSKTDQAGAQAQPAKTATAKAKGDTAAAATAKAKGDTAAAATAKPATNKAAHKGASAAKAKTPAPKAHVPSKAGAKPAASTEHTATFAPDWASAPSARYASMDGAACLAELRQRGVGFTQEASAPGVRTPVRVPDGVGGVAYHTAQSRETRAKSPWDVFDCRVVLALDDFSKILHRHDIDEVLIFSGWRPPPKGWPADKQGIRHPGGLAVDIFRFGKWQAPDAVAANAGPAPILAAPAAGTTVVAAPAPAAPVATPATPATTSPAPVVTPVAASGAKPGAAKQRVWLDMADHFGGQIGSETCGPNARPPQPASAEGTELRAIICEAAEERIFTSMLTPNYNRPHWNHLHVDLAEGAHWRIVR